ncbi:MAG: hypothetical protein ACOYLQ_19685 [Hyphomicrobiaceae bacterium]
MSRAPTPAIKSLTPEKVAYWYFRLNDFLQIENFVVHPERRGGQRTDADLLAVRFPFRAERLFDNPDDIMADDEQGLALSRELIDIVIAEVKTNQPCTLNGPWTQQDRQNVHRVLAAIGCLPHNQIDAAAADIYQAGFHRSNTLRIRLVAVGRDQSEDLARDYPEVQQLLWPAMLAFIWQRFDRYRHQKTQVDQWDAEGRKIKRLADEHRRSCDYFVEHASHLMGVRYG